MIDFKKQIDDMPWKRPAIQAFEKLDITYDAFHELICNCAKQLIATYGSDLARNHC